ncbi:hypothetical protein BHE74_00016296 [Ensete ventricosum]|uniref:Uncharacterized protein n=1 Tax=Ensete ventricosum TaxID=4639 RepID=A0A426XRE2_ENSVE|nr:hypothetical protein B296_00040758 [Ensete ventricosum]RWW26381.1 hypothetical protein GW17_00009238 [Ensete ventricosum]RWW75661.1 hypothetical protein BHE74_00016296 [Ensete ventricosum]RZS13490.1 hypothetical protein BHM03_00045109 [Ensete ventricosum]
MVNLTPPCFLHGTLRGKETWLVGPGRACSRIRERSKRGEPPLEQHRHDPAAVDADLLPRRLGHVEVLARGVAPPAVVVGERVVGGAEVGGGDRHRHAPDAPPGIRLEVADDLVALPARRAVVEQRRAQGGCPGAVPRRVQVAVATSSTCTPNNPVRPRNHMAAARSVLLITHCSRRITATVKRGGALRPP